MKRFDPASDPDVAQALAKAIRTGVSRTEIDRVLVDATKEHDDPLAPIIVAGKLDGLARVHRIRAGKVRD